MLPFPGYCGSVRYFAHILFLTDYQNDVFLYNIIKNRFCKQDTEVLHILSWKYVAVLPQYSCAGNKITVLLRHFYPFRMVFGRSCDPAFSLQALFAFFIYLSEYIPAQQWQDQPAEKLLR